MWERRDALKAAADPRGLTLRLRRRRDADRGVHVGGDGSVRGVLVRDWRGGNNRRVAVVVFGKREADVGVVAQLGASHGSLRGHHLVTRLDNKLLVLQIFKLYAILFI